MGSPGTISVKKNFGWQGTKWRRKIAEIYNRLSRVHERYRQTTDDKRQTDGRATANSERAKNNKTLE